MKHLPSCKLSDSGFFCESLSQANQKCQLNKWNNQIKKSCIVYPYFRTEFVKILDPPSDDLLRKRISLNGPNINLKIVGEPKFFYEEIQEIQA